MKRFITVLLVFVVLSAISYANEFTVTGFVYNYDGTSGTASTPNSFAYFYGYRIGVAAQVATHLNGYQVPPCISPNKIFAADGTDAAYCSTDVESFWGVPPSPLSAGQVARIVFEVSPTGNCFTGEDSYVACTTRTILPEYLPALGMMLPLCQLKLLPSPAIAQSGLNYISITWTGIDMDDIESYGIYRDENGNGNYALVATIVQARNVLITYTDNDAALAQGKTYTYKLSARFIWGGGNGAPDYFETNARSKKSAGAQLLPPTYTITPTHTAVMFSPTQTETHTLTATQTFTPTLTQTASFTQTYTDTYTMTSTVTDTVTVTYTMTATPTVTVTLTVSNTATATMTPDATLTPTIIPALVREKVLVFNNPVRNSRVVLAFLAPSTGQAVIDFYNINAELVRRYKVSADYGPNNFSADFKGVSPGVYIIRINVNGTNLPERKVGVIK